MSHLQLMQTAQPIMSKNPDGGVYIATSSVAVCSEPTSNDLRGYKTDLK